MSNKEDKKKNKAIQCCGKDLEFKIISINPNRPSYHPQIAECPECNAYFEKKDKNDFAYKSIDDGASFSCTKCGGNIQGVRVAHPIHDGLFFNSGSGECYYEIVPYCPSCEKKPNFHGDPVIEEPTI